MCQCLSIKPYVPTKINYLHPHFSSTKQNTVPLPPHFLRPHIWFNPIQIRRYPCINASCICRCTSLAEGRDANNMENARKLQIYVTAFNNQFRIFPISPLISGCNYWNGTTWISLRITKKEKAHSINCAPNESIPGKTYLARIFSTLKISGTHLWIDNSIFQSLRCFVQLLALIVINNVESHLPKIVRSLSS